MTILSSTSKMLKFNLDWDMSALRILTVACYGYNITDGQDDSLAAELYSEEGHVSRPALNPLSINRKPEGAAVTIWDQEDFGEPLVLDPCNLTKLKAELKTPHQVVLTGTIQHSQYNDNELVRINALMNKSFDLAIEVEQSDLFDDPKTESKEKAEEPKE